MANNRTKLGTQLRKDFFLRRYRDFDAPVDDLSKARRLESVDVPAADTNADGRIAGRREVSALWDELYGADSVEAQPPPRRGLFGRETARAAKTDPRMSALESFRRQGETVRRARARGDRYIQEGTLRGGPARGEPIDTSKARPVVPLDQAARLKACARAGIHPAQVAHAFANFSHDGRFWITLIPYGAVQDVDLLQESFPAPIPAAHSMLRFRLAADKPAILVPQDGDPEAPCLELPDLVFSSEAVGQPGFRYDLLAGQLGHFHLVDRMESLEDRLNHTQSRTPPHPVTQLRIRLPDAAKPRVLAAAIEASQRRGLDQRYNTANRSCGTEAFDVLDRGQGGDVPFAAHLGRIATGERIPTLGWFYLWLRGLHPRKADALPNLEIEMEGSPRRARPRPTPVPQTARHTTND